MLDPLEPKLQLVVTHHMGAEIGSRSFGRVASALITEQPIQSSSTTHYLKTKLIFLNSMILQWILCVIFI